MTTIRIGGVPEHFNMPWHYALDNQLFQQADINLEWHDYPGGTGAMASALRSDELDMAIMLTEGAIMDVHKGADNSILGFYVASPLIWGIHVAAKSDIMLESEVFDKRYAISRKGSGSHLMALIHADENGLSIAEEQLVTVNNIDGAVSSLMEMKSDIFFWEIFMTAKYVESQIFRRVGEYPTPWPCFVLVVKNGFYTQNAKAIAQMIYIVETLLLDFKSIPNLSKMIAEKYKLDQDLVETWLKTVEWAKQIKISEEEISNVKKMLTKTGAIF